MKLFTDYTQNKSDNNSIYRIEQEKQNWIDVSISPVQMSEEESPILEDVQKNPTEDLMRYVADAVSSWAKKYNLESLPPQIIFQQALTAINALNDIYNMK